MCVLLASEHKCVAPGAFYSGGKHCLFNDFLELDESTARRHLKSHRSLSGRYLHLTLVTKWSRSHMTLKIQISRSWPRSNLLSHLRPRVQIDMLAFPFVAIGPLFGWGKANFIIDFENSRPRSWPRSRWSHLKPRVLSMCLLFVSWQSDHFWLRYSQLKIQGHDENRPKSNQLIYGSGPTIVPKMKEIQKVVQKLSRGQESAAGGGGVWNGTKT